ncbi:hypothetical protein EZ242_03300 [Ramlibacter rhizophilus]|uniref:Uncharacterized protein n=1 Tax=Ramlibacter rhizophilus TaxID=1781167 RepID=A0A4Z0C2U2_9BURK|nr:hypothetical protein EZ242_03300 [Ramlibacter rhizophilus]
MFRSVSPGGLDAVSLLLLLLLLVVLVGCVITMSSGARKQKALVRLAKTLKRHVPGFVRQVARRV